MVSLLGQDRKYVARFVTDIDSDEFYDLLSYKARYQSAVALTPSSKVYGRVPHTALVGDMSN